MTIHASLVETHGVRLYVRVQHIREINWSIPINDAMRLHART